MSPGISRWTYHADKFVDMENRLYASVEDFDRLQLKTLEISNYETKDGLELILNFKYAIFNTLLMKCVPIMKYYF